jgi:hypothetical protein
LAGIFLAFCCRIQYAVESPLISNPFLESPSMTKDQDQLKLLAILYYLLAGLAMLMTVFFTVMFFVLPDYWNGMQPRINGAPMTGTEGGGHFFSVLSMIYLGIFMLGAFLCTMTGFCLMRQHGRGFCIVISGLMCLLFPIGTLLGVATLMVLGRDSVRQLFEGERA